MLSPYLLPSSFSARVVSASADMHLFAFKLYYLPLEIVDIIVQKSYIHWISNASSMERDKDVIRSLMAVDVCFYRRIIRQRFKKAIWRYL